MLLYLCLISRICSSCSWTSSHTGILKNVSLIWCPFHLRIWQMHLLNLCSAWIKISSQATSGCFLQLLSAVATPTFCVIIKCDSFFASRISMYFIVIVRIWSWHSFCFFRLYETKTSIETKCASINLMSFSIDRLQGVIVCSSILCQHRWDWNCRKFFCQLFTGETIISCQISACPTHTCTELLSIPYSVHMILIIAYWHKLQDYMYRKCTSLLMQI